VSATVLHRTGPEHFLEAERLLTVAMTCADWEERRDCVRAAGVHAQLAQVAASVVRVSGGVQETANASEWLRVLRKPTEDGRICVGVEPRGDG
jgi:hypothetical protein